MAELLGPKGKQIPDHSLELADLPYAEEIDSVLVGELSGSDIVFVQKRTRYQVSFADTDWVGDLGPFSLVIPELQHKLGSNSILGVQVRDSLGEIVVLDSSVDLQGNITLESSVKFSGNVLLQR